MSKKESGKGKSEKEFGEHSNRIPKKLIKIERPESTSQQDDVPALEWKPVNKGVLIGGYVTKDITFPNKFGGKGRILIMDVLEFKHPKKIKKPGNSLKVFVPAKLAAMLEGVDFKGYIKIKYLGKEDIQGESQASHQFELDAEIYEELAF